MFQYKKRNQAVIIAERKTEALNAKLLQAEADLEYLAMMSDIDIEKTTNEQEGYHE